MNIFSYTEENYLKSIYHLCNVNANTDDTSTNNIASFLHIKPATVTSMLQKLCDKKLITYKPYSKVKLSKTDSKKKAILFGLAYPPNGFLFGSRRCWRPFFFAFYGFAVFQTLFDGFYHIIDH